MSMSNSEIYEKNSLEPWFDISNFWSRTHEILIRCPICGSDYQHHGVTTVFHRPVEDGPTTVYRFSETVTEDPLEPNPSRRRDAVRISFWCEEEHEWWMDIVQHKGQTFVFWRAKHLRAVE